MENYVLLLQAPPGELQLGCNGIGKLRRQIGCKINLYFSYSTSHWLAGTTKCKVRQTEVDRVTATCTQPYMTQS